MRESQLLPLFTHDSKDQGNFINTLRQRPYHVEYTSSRSITEVKQHRARLVLGWETAWEHRVLLAFYFFFFNLKLFLRQKVGMKPNELDYRPAVSRASNRMFRKKKDYLHRPGIEPGPPAWQASILPLNQRCLDIKQQANTRHFSTNAITFQLYN